LTTPLAMNSPDSGTLTSDRRKKSSSFDERGLEFAQSVLEQ